MNAWSWSWSRGGGSQGALGAVLSLTLSQTPSTQILTLRPASPQPASPQPPAVEKQHSEPFPVPSKPKRVRSVSGALDLAAVSIPSARLIAHEGGRSHTIYDLHVRPMGRISGWCVA